MKGLIEDRLAELVRLYPVWEKKTIWKFFETTAGRYPDWEFVGAEGRESFTYGQALDQVQKTARGFAALGVKAGDHVAVQMENCPELVWVSLALNAVGAVKVPVNVSLSARELAFVLDQSESRYLVTGRPAGWSGELKALKQVVVLEEDGAGAQSPGPETEHSPAGAAGPESPAVSAGIPVQSWQAFVAAGQGQDFRERQGEALADEVCDIIYTSGSTRAPKGVMLTHDMLMRSAYASCLNRGFEPGRRIFVPLPQIGRAHV